jgi:hypothetical protein
VIYDRLARFRVKDLPFGHRLVGGAADDADVAVVELHGPGRAASPERFLGDCLRGELVDLRDMGFTGLKLLPRDMAKIGTL